MGIEACISVISHILTYFDTKGSCYTSRMCILIRALAVRIGHFSKYNLLSILYCVTFSSGPQHWHLDYPHCGGVKQSPIDIDTNDVIVDSSHLQPFMFSGYDSVSNVNMSMVNNGHTGEFSLSHEMSHDM